MRYTEAREILAEAIGQLDEAMTHELHNHLIKKINAHEKKNPWSDNPHADLYDTHRAHPKHVFDVSKKTGKIVRLNRKPMKGDWIGDMRDHLAAPHKYGRKGFGGVK